MRSQLRKGTSRKSFWQSQCQILSANSTVRWDFPNELWLFNDGAQKNRFVSSLDLPKGGKKNLQKHLSSGFLYHNSCSFGWADNQMYQWLFMICFCRCLFFSNHWRKIFHRTPTFFLLLTQWKSTKWLRGERQDDWTHPSRWDSDANRQGKVLTRGIAGWEVRGRKTADVTGRKNPTCAHGFSQDSHSGAKQQCWGCAVPCEKYWSNAFVFSRTIKTLVPNWGLKWIAFSFQDTKFNSRRFYNILCPVAI